eukprot:CAMPEP_0179415708 /NCGR_PEP_ID=MMETSP0799-20121207/6388_1 /TAXON_ID=46947 /ORGANISM="Geminigera cryophila, Strain CCMP2564" /LENGTH=101 /DNA_ID=CAMNT_0021188489 /DNA_START=131 /DNA_END=434 /DNA_ORIENTATION=+
MASKYRPNNVETDWAPKGNASLAKSLSPGVVYLAIRQSADFADPAIVQIQLEETAPQHAQLVFDMTAPSAIATIEAARPKVDEDICLLINSIAWEESDRSC